MRPTLEPALPAETSEAQTRAAAQDVLSRGGEDDELYIIPVVFHVIVVDGGRRTFPTRRLKMRWRSSSSGISG